MAAAAKWSATAWHSISTNSIASQTADVCNIFPSVCYSGVNWIYFPIIIYPRLWRYVRDLGIWDLALPAKKIADVFRMVSAAGVGDFSMLLCRNLWQYKVTRAVLSMASGVIVACLMLARSLYGPVCSQGLCSPFQKVCRWRSARRQATLRHNKEWVYYLTMWWQLVIVHFLAFFLSSTQGSWHIT